MSISKHFVVATPLFLLLALVGATSSQPKRFLRHVDVQDRTKHRRTKSDKSSKSGYMTATPTTIPPASTIPPGTNLQDWIDACGNSSNKIDSCVVSQSAPTNCKTCLFALGTSHSPKPANPIPNGVKVCAMGMCGECDQDEIVPFYACGLQVEANSLNPDASVEVDVDVEVDVEVDVDPQSAVVEPPATTDMTNCPAVWPGSVTNCVMLGGYNRKYCLYYEYTPYRICTCDSPQHIWNCTNGSESNDLP